MNKLFQFIFFNFVVVAFYWNTMALFFGTLVLWGTDGSLLTLLATESHTDRLKIDWWIKCWWMAGVKSLIKKEVLQLFSTEVYPRQKICAGFYAASCQCASSLAQRDHLRVSSSSTLIQRVGSFTKPARRSASQVIGGCFFLFKVVMWKPLHNWGTLWWT